jgi:hypothetical protein
MLDERAYRLKVRYLSGKHGSRCGGHKREGMCALPGEICPPVSIAWELPTSRDAVKGGQKSAEAIVGISTMPKGRTRR